VVSGRNHAASPPEIDTNKTNDTDEKKTGKRLCLSPRFVKYCNTSLAEFLHHLDNIYQAMDLDFFFFTKHIMPVKNSIAIAKGSSSTLSNSGKLLVP